MAFHSLTDEKKNQCLKQISLKKKYETGDTCRLYFQQDANGAVRFYLQIRYED